MAPRRDLDGFRDGRISAVRAVHYDTADGMKTSEASNPASQPGGWRTRDGKLWFTTQKGIVVVDPRRLQHNDRIPWSSRKWWRTEPGSRRPRVCASPPAKTRWNSITRA
jgi:hypothetical protein